LVGGYGANLRVRPKILDQLLDGACNPMPLRADTQVCPYKYLVGGYGANLRVRPKILDQLLDGACNPMPLRADT